MTLKEFLDAGYSITTYFHNVTLQYDHMDRISTDMDIDEYLHEVVDESTDDDQATYEFVVHKNNARVASFDSTYDLEQYIQEL